LNRSPVRGAARLAAILDALPDALLLVDASSTVVNANAAALELFEGESAQRLLGKPLTTLLPSFGRSVATVGDSPRALPAGSGANGAEAHPSARSKPERQAAARTDGTVFPAEVSSAALPGEDEELVLLIIRDLTGVLDVEAELRRQQRQIELILRAASEGIVGVDHEGRIVLVNPAGAKILRYRASDLGAQNVHELIAHSTADGTPTTPEQCSLIDSLRSGTKHHASDEVLWRSDGTPVFVDLTTAPVYEGENIIGAVMTFTDNSAAQAAARQSRELVTLLEQQLQGPLSSALTQLRETTEYGIGEIGPGVRQALMTVAAELAHANTVVDDLVDYQRLVIGDTRFEPRLVSLTDVIDSAVAAAGDLAEAMGVDIVAHTPEIDVSLDPELFGKLLAHLLADMVNATPIGGKILLATTRRDAVLRIELRGPHTGGNATHLSIARAIASRHGGTLTTHRIAGKGNTHVIQVPWETTARSSGNGSVDTRSARQPAALTSSVSVSTSSTSSSSSGSPASLSPVSLPTASTSASRKPLAEPVVRETTLKAREKEAPQPVEPPTVQVDEQDEHVNGQPNGHVGEQRAFGTYSSSGSGSSAEVGGSSGSGSPSSSSGSIRTTQVNGRTQVPTQSRSVLSRSIGMDPADLKPSKPLPTSDVWSRPGRPEPIGPGGSNGLGSSNGLGGQGGSGDFGADAVNPLPRGRRRSANEQEQADAFEQARASEPEVEMEPPEQQAEPEPEPVEPTVPAPRLLLWPEPDTTTTSLLDEHGYASVPLSTPEELTSVLRMSAGLPRPAAVFVDPIAAPITRRGLRALHGAASAAGLPLLVTAGIGNASLGSAPGPDPAMLLQALTPAAAALPRVMLVEERPELAAALTRSLERQGMQVLHAATDTESVAAAVRGAPDVVLMDLMQIRRRRVGIVEWLRDQRRLPLTPIVVYTALDVDPANVAALRAGAWSLYLAERAVDVTAGARIADLLSKVAAI
jgi:PAS domain S-box-containing protein